MSNPVPQILFALAILHAGHLMQLSMRQPSAKKISQKTESGLFWFLGSTKTMLLARFITVSLAIYHAVLSLALTNTLPNNSNSTTASKSINHDYNALILTSTCPQPTYLSPTLFTWSKSTVAALGLLYVGSYIRFQAYAQLGANFTYRLSKPSHLVTTGLYAYVRHPSYTGLFAVLMAMYTLFLQQHGIVSCWVERFEPTTGLGKKMLEDERVGFVVPAVGFGVLLGFFLGWRMREEERMMEGVFAGRWKEYCRGTKRFLPFVY